MWIYQKKLEFPVNITTPDLRVARALMAQYGGPDSELAAVFRYLNDMTGYGCHAGILQSCSGILPR